MVKVIWRKAASPPHIGRFNRIRQVDILHWVHPSPYPKRHLDRFSRFWTAHGTMSVCFTTGPLSPSKLPLRMGDLGPI